MSFDGVVYDKDILNEIWDEVNSSIDLSREYSDSEIYGLIEEAVVQKGREKYLSIHSKHNIINAVFNSKRKLDVLQPLVDDDAVTEIMVIGHEKIFIEKGGIISRTNVKFESEEKLYNLIQVIVSGVNRTVNESSPIVDARLKNGSRVNIVLPPAVLDGPVVTIRKFPEDPFDMARLVNTGTISEEACSFLCTAVRARYNIFISGGTGSGKTTVLNALAGLIPPNERIITIEDSAELCIRGIANLVRMETRNTNTEGRGEITIRDLIRTSLRMRPDRIIVGEVRGAEALDMLQAMNTGHDGSISTGHANSTADMLGRLETMVLCGSQMPLDAIRQQIASAIDIIIFLGRVRDGSRKMLEISEIAGYRKGEIILNPLYVFREKDTDAGGKEAKVKGKLDWMGSKLMNEVKIKMAGMEMEYERTSAL